MRDGHPPTDPTINGSRANSQHVCELRWIQKFFHFIFFPIDEVAVHIAAVNAKHGVTVAGDLVPCLLAF